MNRAVFACKGSLARCALAGLLLVLCQVSPALALDDPRLPEAKELFRRGVAELEAGDLEQALAAFQQSRALVPSARNSVNAAICLERLGHADEAFELYQDVDARFAAELESADLDALREVMRGLSLQLGWLEVSANVSARLSIDGRARGELPRSARLAVLAGSREIRLDAAGYEPVTRTLNILVGKSQRLEFALSPPPSAPAPAPPRALPPAAEKPFEAAPPRPTWSFRVSAGTALFLAPALNGDAESGCPELCARSRVALGGAAFAALGARHRAGLGVEGRLGYLGFTQRFSRALFEDADAGTTTYALEQKATAHAPFALLLGSYTSEPFAHLELTAALGVGALLASYETSFAGVAWRDGPAWPLRPTVTRELTEVAPVAALLFRLERRFGKVALGAGLGGFLFPVSGPRLSATELVPQAGCLDQQSSCPDASSRLSGERWHGTFVALTPELSLSLLL